MLNSKNTDKTTVIKFLCDWKLKSDINDVVSFVTYSIDTLQYMTNFKICSRETNVLDRCFNMSCEMKGRGYEFMRVYIEYLNDRYYAYLLYVVNNNEIIDNKIFAKDKLSIIENMREFVENVEQKIKK